MTGESISNVRADSPLRTVARGLCCAAAVCLTVAVVLSLWSLFGASTISWNVAPYPYRGAVEQLAWWALGGAIVALVALVGALQGRRWGLAIFVALGTGIALLASAAAYPGGLFATYRVLSSGYAATQALPAAMAAWVLAVSGCAVVVIAGLPLIDMGPVRRCEIAGGAVAGALVAVVVGYMIMRDADPGRQYDASMADMVAVPSIPASLVGRKQFSLGFDASLNRDSWDAGFSVRAAGSGFVVRERNGVRAYDSNGRERWHLLHRGGWQVRGFQVFDDAATVVVSFSSDAFGSGEVLGLDATTGQQLWRSADSDLYGGPGREWIRSTDDSGLFYLTVQDGDALTRIDSRTGDRSWTVQVPGEFERIDTRSGIGYLTGSVTNGQAEVRYVSLDPATGHTRFDVVASSYPVSAIQEPDLFLDTQVFSVVHAGRDGIAFRNRIGKSFYVNGVAGAVTPLDGRVEHGYPMADDFVEEFPYPRDDVRRLREAPDAAVRCVLPDGFSVGGTGWLRDEMVGHQRSSGLASVRRADCSIVPRGSSVDGGDGVVVVPGATLVVDHRKGAITGYT